MPPQKIIIVGGGPAGTVAAIAAARNGARTLLIESRGCLGGQMTSGLLTILSSFDDMDRRDDRLVEQRLNHSDEKSFVASCVNLPTARRINRGIAEEIVRRLEAARGAIDIGTGCLLVNPETAKRVLEEMVLESGAQIRYFTSLVDATRKGSKITGIVVASKDGAKTLAADQFIDATGDGDLAAFAGVPFEKGRPEDGQMQGVTLVFRLGGVKFFGRSYAHSYEKETQRCNKIFERAWKEKRVSGHYRVGCINAIPGMPGVVSINCQHCWWIDGTKEEDLTKMMITARKEIHEIVQLYRQHLKGFEDCFLLDTAAMPGVRDTRRIKGKYTMTEQDVLQARKFNDSIGKGAWALDVHIPSKVKVKPGEIFMKPGTAYDIPYRCLVPVGVDNLLVAGRCISATHKALGALRLMSHCMVMGQAAGTAAALCVKKACPTRKLDVGLLQKTLKKDGAVV
ncbi:MAG: FAD-dependent oxidoreductase [Verrucomicrobiae bacterium]|nr:FAD-dependent oxidoreductase [Verrucomicrobiae bacterium]